MSSADDSAEPFEVGDGPSSCLLLHGFTGTPWDVRPLGDALAARGYRVHAPLLPGHGLVPEAMLHVRAADWVAASEAALARLPLGPVFVGGLSMGGLLALVLAARYPERVRALALLAPAVRFKGPLMTFLRATRKVPWLEWVKPWVHKTATDLSDPDALRRAPLIPRFPSARLGDLWTLQDLASDAEPKVRAPTLIVVAEHDHVVDPDAGAYLQHRLAAASEIRCVRMARGFHILPRDVDGPAVAREVTDFFQRLR